MYQIRLLQALEFGMERRIAWRSTSGIDMVVRSGQAPLNESGQVAG